jgi:hypothetical protein
VEKYVVEAEILVRLSKILLAENVLEGITHQPPKPPSRPRLPHQNFLDFSKSLENSKKKIQIIEREYLKHSKYCINFSNLWR